MIVGGGAAAICVLPYVCRHMCGVVPATTPVLQLRAGRRRCEGSALRLLRPCGAWIRPRAYLICGRFDSLDPSGTKVNGQQKPASKSAGRLREGTPSRLRTRQGSSRPTLLPSYVPLFCSIRKSDVNRCEGWQSSCHQMISWAVSWALW